MYFLKQHRRTLIPIAALLLLSALAPAFSFFCGSQAGRL